MPTEVAASERRPLLIRAPNHLGDLIMSLPALQKARPDAVLAPAALAPLLELAGQHTISFRRGSAGGFLDAMTAVRRRNFQRGILFTPSFSSAFMLALANVRERRGTGTDARGLLLTDVVDADVLEHAHRAAVYMLLATCELPALRPVPQLTVPEHLRQRFRALLPPQVQQLIGIFPGSNAPARRWGVQRFTELARQLARESVDVVVFGGPGEKELTTQVAGDVAIDLGGRTDLPLLAAGLATCDLVVSNDSGPLHLAAAVGTRTVSMWGAGDPEQTGPPAGHVILRAERLPCLECVKNQCPRRGKGYILPNAYMECMQLIEVPEVVAAAHGGLVK